MENLRQYFEQEFCIIHGVARGADLMARRWAQDRGICCIEVPANWIKYEKKGGGIRNQWMLDFCSPDLVIAFPGKAGTGDMIRRAKKAGVAVYEVKE